LAKLALAGTMFKHRIAVLRLAGLFESASVRRDELYSSVVDSQRLYLSGELSPIFFTEFADLKSSWPMRVDLFIMGKRLRVQWKNNPRSHTNQLCWCDLVWFSGSFLFNPNGTHETKLRHYPSSASVDTLRSRFLYCKVFLASAR
jgi:hypothetical protein